MEVKEIQNTASVANCKTGCEDIELTLSPNPNRGEFTVQLTVPKNEVYSIYITDVNGRKILSDSKSAQAGINSWQFSLPKLRKGVYVFHVRSSETNVSRNFIVEK